MCNAFVQLQKYNELLCLLRRIKLKKKFIIFLLITLLFCHNFTIFVLAEETRFPNYSYEFLGDDNYEGFNRKVFNFNLKLNKYVLRPVHIIWASLMPQYGMDRIQSMANNIEYPIRLISSLIQKDFETSKNETIRFFTNTILGLGGMYDPAKKLFKIEQSNENMEQALAGCKIKPGRYFVLPVLSFTTPRGILGKILDTALNPGSYIGTPILAIIKACLTINRTSYYQCLIKMLESTFADPYEIAKTVYGISSYVKCANLDRINFSQNLYTPAANDEKKEIKEQKPVLRNTVSKPAAPKEDKVVKIEVSSEIATPDILYGGAIKEDSYTKSFSAEDFRLEPDINLPGYNPQSPVIDSMRTALLNNPEVNKSIWNELSIWNRSFANRIKTSKIKVTEGKEDYKFRYILQKTNDKSPVAIIFPSIGEGINSEHSVILAKMFYDAGYSVIIQGSHFQLEFVNSMPQNYHPGLPAEDARMILMVTSKIIEKLKDKYDYEFENKVFIGTSFGALEALFVGAEEYKHNTLGNSRFISVCPPVELLYAMKQVDKNAEEWNKQSDDFKHRAALTAAKIMKFYDMKNDDISFEINNLPFSDYEAKLITSFLMHQKLSDLIFFFFFSSNTKPKSDFYNYIHNTGYEDYTKKYVLPADYKMEDLSYDTSLYSIAYFLENSNNYKIYHSVNDYLTTPYQMKKLKQYSKDKLTLFDNGAHLGFLYRNEFLENLKKTIINE